jgi:beta-mannosidase
MDLLSQWYIESRTGGAHLSLEGTWDFTWAEKLCENPESLDWKYQTRLPNSVYWSLYEAGVLPHPYEKNNSKQYAWVDGMVWYYRKKFVLGPGQDRGRAFLCADGAAYYTRLWVNGQLTGDHAGMFGGPVAELHSRLRFGGEENEVIFAVRSADYGGDLPPYAFQSRENKAIVPWNVLKDSRTSNGDFSVLGLWRPVRIEFLPPLHLARPYLTTVSLEGDARLHLQVELIQDEINELEFPRDHTGGCYDYTFAYRNGLASAFLDKTVQLRISFTEKDTGRAALEKIEDVRLLDYAALGCLPGYGEANYINLDLLLKEAHPWNPAGLGDPFLYEVSLVLLDGGRELDRLAFDYGVRTIGAVRTAGNQYRSRWDDFQFVVNGKEFFLKGVNWMPLDFLYKEDEREYRWILEMVKSAGIQLIRVWSGGGYPESDCFYALCDELGIMVWQDNFIANMDTPNWPQDVLQAQVCINLYRIRNHPSLAVHCGGNEFNPYSFGNAASMFVIERNIRDLDPSRLFKRTTPDRGSAHIYRDMEPTWYRHCYGQLPFVGESGIHSFPNAKSLKQLMSPEEYAKPVDDMMAESFKVSHPELLNHFTEYVPERVPRMLARASALTNISSASLEEMAEATQMASAEFYQIMIQSFRENYPVSGGIMLWVLKRSWTTIGIQLIDGLGEPIIPFYHVKNAYAPVAIQVSLPHLIWGVHEEMTLPLNLINESGEDIPDLTVRLEVYSPALKKVMEKNYAKNISGGTFLTAIDRAVFLIPEDFRDHFFFVRSALYRKDRLIHQSLYWPKCLSLMDDDAFRKERRSAPRENIVFQNGPWLKDEIRQAEKAVLRAACQKIASPSVSADAAVSASAAASASGRHCFSVRLSNDSPHAAFPVSIAVADPGCVHYASDNFFFMAPGETRELRLEIFDRTGELSRFRLNIGAWNAEPLQIFLDSGDSSAGMMCKSR